VSAKRRGGVSPKVELLDLVSRRVPTREQLSRGLAMYGAFSASGKIMDGDDRATLEHLRRLRVKLTGERGEAVERVIRGLEVIMEKSTHP